jgi:membrane protein implicated in regulation of membrane protease activity
MNLEWWHWAVLGIVLVLAELAIPAFFIIWFGLGGLIVAGALLLAPGLSLVAQIGLWTAASLAMVVAWFKIFKTGEHKTRIGMADSHVIGEIGMLVQDVAPYRNGQVRFQKPLMGSDTWACMADEELSSGARVRVTSVEGTLLKVGKV